MSSRLCTICLNPVVDDNSRGKAELVCGHLFHLDCIGSEFNYKCEMKCPNCRVVEDGEWLLPDEEELVDEDDDYSMHVRRLELHIYSHGGRGDSPTSRTEIGAQERRSPMVAPTVHYHHNTVVLPPNYGSNTSAIYANDPLNAIADTLLRAYGSPQDSNSTQQTRVDPVVLQDTSISRPNGGEVTAYYRRSRYHHNSPTSTIMDTEPIHTNMTGYRSLSSYALYNDPSLELTLTTNPSEHRSQHGSHEGRSS